MARSIPIVVNDEPGKWLDHPRLGAILVAALKARRVASVPDHVPLFAESWSIHISGTEEGIVNVHAGLFAASLEEARSAVQGIYDAARADGHEMFMRAEPEAESQRDFEYDVTLHKGYVRFAVLPHAGPVHHRERFDGEMRYFALPKVAQ